MLLRLIAILLLSLAAGYAAHSGLTSMGQMRAVERLPEIKVAEIIPGVVQLSGKATSDGPMVTAPSSRRQTLYFRHVEERKVRDSEGGYYWRTVSDTRDATSFLRLEDETGSVRIYSNRGRQGFSAPRKYQQTRGDRRFTEYRIDPGDAITVLGLASPVAHTLGISLHGLPEHYVARVSAFGESHQRQSLARTTLMSIWFSLAAVALIVLTLCWTMRIHKVAAFLSLLMVSTLALLMLWSLAAARVDLQVAMEQQEAAASAARETIQGALSQHGLQWDGYWDSLPPWSEALHTHLPEEQARLIERLHVNVARTTERVRGTWEHWPERLVARLSGWERPDSVPLGGEALQVMEVREATFEPTRLEGGAPALILIIGALGAVFMLPIGLSMIHLKRTIENIPTSPSAGATYGLTELKGEILPAPRDEALTSPIEKTRCVYYHYKLEENRGTKKDSWVTISEEKVGKRFICRDREGDFPIDPEGAQVITTRKHTQRQTDRAPGGAIVSSGRYRHTEERLDVGDTLYALGRAQIDPETQQSLYMAASEPPYLLSNLSEAQLMLRKARGGFTSLTLGFIAALAALLTLIGLMGAFNGAALLIAAMITPIYMLIAVVVLMYNDLVFLRNRVDTTWSNIGVSLQKRATLIPTIQEVVKTSMAHERTLQERLAQLRTQASSEAVDIPKAEQLLAVEQQLLQQLRLLRESYPDLTTSQAMIGFHDTLVALENEVAFMRDGFNHAVERYNTRLGHIPEVFLATLLRFRRRDFFRAEVSVATPPDVSAMVPSTK